MIVPHPIPYQGSKRKFAERIFSSFPDKSKRMYEPFVGSAAMTIFAASRGYAEEYVIGDTLSPLVELHKIFIENPMNAARRYAEIWNSAGSNHLDHYYVVRDRYNTSKDPIDLLYCIARCVANAVRFGRDERFTQSVDKRRLGMSPDKMEKHMLQVSMLLKGKVIYRVGDWIETLRDATPNDLVYLDPPYLGTSSGRDKRYHKQLEFENLCTGLEWMNSRNLRYALSYDGATGSKVYGPRLPETLNLRRIELEGGLSSQATLNGKREHTIESLYLSPEMNNVKKL